MTGFDLSVDLASIGTGTGAAGLDLIELHCVKWLQIILLVEQLILIDLL